MIKPFLAEQLLALLLPERCCICGKPVLFHEHHCCRSCLDSLKQVNAECSRCGGIIEDGNCLVCSDRMWYIDRNIAALEYDTQLKELLFQFKANQKKRLYRHLSSILADRLSGEEFMRRIDLIIPVPVSKKRLRERGYNQAFLLASETAERCNLPVSEVLVTSPGKTNQKNMSYARRFLNVPGKFRIKEPCSLSGKRIILIDDVFTTGATINECGRILKEAGAEEIFSATLARAPIKKLEK